MKAVIINKYGGPEVLEYTDLPQPQINDDNILVRVLFSSVNPVDWKVRKGILRFLPGQKLPKILGGDLAGIIEKVGKNITEFKVGDEVYGVIRAVRGGAYAKYAVAEKYQIAIKPKNLKFKEAASIPLAALTAYQALTHLGHLKSGATVCVNGCSGGVGHFAVQIAKALGATVTGVCSTKNINFTEGLGADKIIDYTKVDVLASSAKYDIFFDAVANQSYFRVVKHLNKGGRYITTLPSISVIIGFICRTFSSKTGKIINLRQNSEDLRFLSELIKSKKLKTHIDKIYKLKDIQKAHRHSETGRVVGKIVISVD